MPSPTVLLVAPTDALATGAAAELTRTGFLVTRVSSFSDARQHLQARPDLLISEVRLREHNGLHLAICALGRGIPAIVVGQDDPVTRREAERLGAAYVAEDCEGANLVDAVRATGVVTQATRGGRSSTHAA